MSRSREGTLFTTLSPIRSVALGDVLEAGHHAQRSRLAAPGRPDEHHELAVLDLQIEVVDGACSIRVDLRDVDEGDLSHLGHHTPVNRVSNAHDAAGHAVWKRITT